MKLKIIYVVSLAVLAALVYVAIIHPTMAGSTYTELTKENVVKTDSAYIISFDIINHEGKNMQYTLEISFNTYKYTENVDIRDGYVFTYRHTIDRTQFNDVDVHFAIYKPGESTPFEKLTYHLQ